MILLRLFVKNYTDTDAPAVRKGYGELSGAVGIVLNMILAASKFAIGTITNSVAITADAFNNVTDCLTSLLTILGFKWSAKPADKEHPFGHARIEYLISLAVAGIIWLTGYEVFRNSIEMIANPEPITFTPLALGVLIFAMVVKLWMFFFNRHLGTAIKSDTLLAVGIDSRNDVMITGATLLALGFTLFSDFMIDGYVGAIIAIIFFRSGYQVAREALARIIGNPGDKNVAAEIKKIVKGYDGVLGVHDLVLHSYGPGLDMASLHMEVNAGAEFTAVHDLSEKAANEVLEKLGVQLIIHPDPIDVNDQNLQSLTKSVNQLLQEKYPQLNAHEFRIIKSTPRDILVFDMEVPHDVKAGNKKEALAIRASVIADIKGVAPEYDVDINIEHGYISLQT